ncbi:MAG: hypothetical protein M0R03_19510 [Novosphingobium sp.]|nr:hypothetical protein [Novosphingobium sp.]
MKNKLALLFTLCITLLKPSYSYSMEKNSSMFIDEISSIIIEANEYINYKQIALMTLEILNDKKDNLDENILKKIIITDKLKSNIKKISSSAAITLIGKIIDNISIDLIAKIYNLEGYSKEDKIEIVNNKKELIKSVLLGTSDLILFQKIKTNNRHDIIKSYVKNRLYTSIDSSSLREIVTGFSMMTIAWILGHIFCHDLMEIIEPQQLISTIFYVPVIMASSYFIITKILKVSKNNKNLIEEILPTVAKFLDKKLGISKYITGFVLDKLEIKKK